MGEKERRRKDRDRRAMERQEERDAKKSRISNGVNGNGVRDSRQWREVVSVASSEVMREVDVFVGCRSREYSDQSGGVGWTSSLEVDGFAGTDGFTWWVQRNAFSERERLGTTCLT